MRIKRLVFLVAAICIGLVAYGCGSSDDSGGSDGGDGGESSDTFVIGVTGPFSGPTANFGQAVRQGFELAINEAQADGTVEIAGSPAKIELRFEDAEGDPATGNTVARKLLDSGDVDMLIGDLYSSTVSTALMDLAPLYPDIPMMSGYSTADVIGDKIAEDPEKYANYWKGAWGTRGYVPSLLDGVALAEEAGIVNGKKVAVIAEGTDFGEGIKDAVVEQFEDAGYEIVENATTDYGATDFGAVLGSVKGASPDIVATAFSAPASGIAFGQQYAEQRIPGLFTGIYYPSDPEFLKTAGSDVDGMIWTALQYDPNVFDTQKEMAQQLEEGIGSTPTLTDAFGYTFGQNLLDILARAEGRDAESIAAATSELDRETPLGRFVYDTERHEITVGENELPFPVAQVQNGENVVIAPSNVATGEIKK